MSSFATVPAPQRKDDAPAHPVPTDRELLRWQRRLLPFMTSFVVGMALLFFIFSGWHLYWISNFIQVEHGPDIRTQVAAEIAKPTAGTPSADDATRHALLLLEAETLDKRYHQASALLLSRIWSRQLAFITGMVMAFLGAVFILGKLSESPSQISGGSGDWKVAITSASPGIILSFLGTVLLISALYVRATLDVTDGPAYVAPLRHGASRSSADAAKQDDASAPLSLENLQKLGEQKPAAPAKP